MAKDESREKLIDSFWEEYKKVQKSKSHAVVVYKGIAGIGKTWLVNELLNEIKAKPEKEKPKVVEFRFKGGEDGLEVICSLRQQLKENYKFRFYSFDIGFDAYTHVNMGRVNKGKYFMEKNPETSRGCNFVAFLAEKGTESLANSFLSTAVVSGVTAGAAAGGAAGVFYGTLIGIAAGTVGYIVGANVDNAKESREKKGTAYQEELKEFDKLRFNETKSLDRLFKLFIKDLEDNLQKEKLPLVIIFDTYELLVDERINVGQPLEADKWIRGALDFDYGLVPSITGVLWVIAGREELQWNTMPYTKKVDSLLTCSVNGLEEGIAKKYLEDAGIHNNKLQEGLYKLTEGVPLYLYFCVKTYHSIKNNENREPIMKDFGRTGEYLISYYYQNMDNDMRMVFQTLCCLNRWTDEIATQVIEERRMGVNCLDSYNTIKKFSFIEVDNKSPVKSYSINRVVRKVVLEDKKLSEERKKITINHAIDICKNKTKQFKQTSSSGDAFYLELLSDYKVQLLDCGVKNYEF